MKIYLTILLIEIRLLFSSKPIEFALLRRTSLSKYKNNKFYEPKFVGLNIATISLLQSTPQYK